MAGYPPAAVTASGWLAVGDGQRIWWEEAGNPAGAPAMILHGGPGSGVSVSTRRFFDPVRYRIISFDQRGCGKSTPHASEPDADLSVNTTAHLVADIEELRAHLGIARFVLYGQSWGSTLGLAYAEAYPSRVRAIVLASVTMTRQREIDGLYAGLGRTAPEAWARFKAGAPAGTPDDKLLDAYSALLFDPDPAVAARAARDFHDWDWTSVGPDPGPQPPAWSDQRYVLARARIVTHYFRNAGFLADDALLRGAVALAGIPGVMVQGELDLPMQIETARELAAAWPSGRLALVPGAGHLTGAAGMSEAITAALDEFAETER